MPQIAQRPDLRPQNSEPRPYFNLYQFVQFRRWNSTACLQVLKFNVNVLYNFMFCTILHCTSALPEAKLKRLK